MKRIIVIFFYFLTCILILFINYKLFYSPNYQDGINTDIQKQLNFIEDEIKNGADVEMQNLFPEGSVFLNVLYGLTYADLAVNQNVEFKKKAIIQIDSTLKRLLSENNKSIFDRDLPVPYGVFYTGWSNLLLAKKLSLQPISERKAIDVQLYKDNCRAIIKAMNESQYPFLESYSGNVWPADNIVAMASVAEYQNIVDTCYNYEIKTWIENVKLHLSLATGLIPHSVQFNNKEIEGARGCSQSLMLQFLFDIDSTFAKQQFDLYKIHFLTSRFTLPAICEYPKGVDKEGDVDSGPVIWGIGGAASIVAIRTFCKFGDYKTAIAIRNSVELFGVSQTNDHSKKYIFGVLPMADVFIAWSNVLFKSPSQEKLNIRWVILCISVVICSFLVFLIVKKLKSKN